MINPYTNKKDLYSTTKYKLLLRLLKKETTQSENAFSFLSLHPRHWIPPPCLTSLPQEMFLDGKTGKSTNIFASDSDIFPQSSSDIEENYTVMKSSKKENPVSVLLKRNENVNEILKKKLKEEKQGLKEVQRKAESKEELSSSHKALVHKWQNIDEVDFQKKVYDHSGNENSDTEEYSQSSLNSVSNSENVKSNTKRAERALKNLETSFQCAKEEEEKLRKKLKKLKREEKKGKEIKKPSSKLKKTCYQNEYKILAIKRKYDDLLLYLSRLESKSKELRKENEVLHVALKEENQFRARQKIASLEQKLSFRENELLECRSQLEVMRTLREENQALENLLENLHESERRNEQERKVKDENFEKEWIKKISDMKILYERAVQGYKEQLLNSRGSYESLEQKLREVIDYYETNEKELIKRYENEIKDLKVKSDSAKNENETFVFLRLEALLKHKDDEIEALKTELQGIKENINVDSRVQEGIVKELKDLIEKTTVIDESFLDSIKQTIKKTLEEFGNKEGEKLREFREQEVRLLQENKRLQEELKNRTVEAEELKKSLRRVEKLTPQSYEVFNEKREIDAETLKEFPKLLKEKEEKLKNAETINQKSEIQVKLYEERLRNCSVELELKRTRISELEDRVMELSSNVRKLDRENEKLENKISVLESQIEKKNKILEKNSAQIEDRIRENRSLVSNMERLREDHSKEIVSLKEELKTSHEDPRLREAQIVKEKLESELNSLKSEKNMMEKGLKKRILTLEDEINRLKIKNSTLQNHLHSVQERYKTMFNLESADLTNYDVLNPHLELERNGASK